MNKRQIILDIAKILACAYAIFIGLFALDSWGDWRGFIIHLIPSAIIIVACLVAWRDEKRGGILFFILGALSTLYFKTYKDMNIFLIISLPLFFIGLLFFFNSYGRDTEKIK
ncbi:MAG TPA: hypothetical protein PKL98_00620 [Candidatus Pacearchaeota archaeon]|nr:hypothetical protein [Candidatus Pacearchaeota archaeon]HPM08750.1 hypothetical protein [Candidatus Pacearchaeota archaeon]